MVANLEHHDPVRLLGGLIKLNVMRNSGAAFGIGDGMTVVFTLIAAGVVVAILRTARRLRSLPWAITLGLLLGGALGNLIDRLLRSPGAAARRMSSTGSSCRTGRCSTSPTRRSSAAGGVLAVVSRATGDCRSTAPG